MAQNFLLSRTSSIFLTLLIAFIQFFSCFLGVLSSLLNSATFLLLPLQIPRMDQSLKLTNRRQEASPRKSVVQSSCQYDDRHCSKCGKKKRKQNLDSKAKLESLTTESSVLMRCSRSTSKHLMAKKLRVFRVFR